MLLKKHKIPEFSDKRYLAEIQQRIEDVNPKSPEGYHLIMEEFKIDPQNYDLIFCYSTEKEKREYLGMKLKIMIKEIDQHRYMPGEDRYFTCEKKVTEMRGKRRTFMMVSSKKQTHAA